MSKAQMITRPLVVMLSKTQLQNGYFQVDISLDEGIPTDFAVESLVSNSFSNLFQKDPQNSNIDFTSSQFDLKSFLGLISAIRYSGWNILAMSSMVNQNRANVQIFYLEFVFDTGKL